MLTARILAVAQELFTRQGYQATTVRQIAFAAKVTHTTIYTYFDSKAEIIVRLGAQAFPALERLAAELDQIAPEREALSAWVRSYAGVWRAHRGVFDAFWEAAMAEQEIAARLLPSTIYLAEQMPLTLGGRADDEAAALKRRIGLFFLYVHQMLSITRLATSGEADEEEVLENIAGLLLFSLQAWRVRPG